MIFETVKTEGLAQLSYLVGDSRAGVCAVIDPRRDVEVYLELARRHGVRIAHILETHIHADFVSGSRELASRTRAPIRVGRSEEYAFPHEPLEDGEVVPVGEFELEALHTPGHSPEHLCYLIRGGTGSEEPWGAFTGDTLFAGSVGRPDLSAGTPKEELAGALFHPLRERLLPLGDGVVVYPGHGAGSPCGSSIGERDVTAIGYERRRNQKLQVDDEAAFVEAVLADLPEEPRYYPRMKEVNARGPAVTAGLPHLPPIDPETFRELAEAEDIVVVDAREIEAFSGAHIEGSLNIGLRASFPIWAGWMLVPEEEILLVAPGEADVEPIQRHLFRIGLDRIGGWLWRGMRGWIEAGLPFARREDLSVHQLRDRVPAGGDGLQLLDVRSDSEWEEGHIPGARHIHAPYVAEQAGDLDPERPVTTYCGSGYRASLAASVLAREGFRVRNVPGSMSAWLAAGHPLEDGRK